MEECLKFCQNLQAVITGQTITDPQGSEQTPIQTSLQENYGRHRVNKINYHLEQFLPRDNRTPQVKLAEDKLMDIIENAVPKSWQWEMHQQKFNCTAKGQAKFIWFCKCLELLDSPK
eukprot:2679832-Ditylum_brightwellii.AAC.1